MPFFVNNLLVVYPTLLFLEIFNAHMECFVLARLILSANQRCAGPKVHDPTDALQHCWVEGAKSPRGLGCGWLAEKWRKFVTFQTGHFPNHHEPFWLRQNLEEPFWGGFGFPRRFLNGARQGHEKEVTPSSLSSSLWGWHLWIERFYGWGYTKAGTARMSRVESWSVEEVFSNPWRLLRWKNCWWAISLALISSCQSHQVQLDAVEINAPGPHRHCWHGPVGCSFMQ